MGFTNHTALASGLYTPILADRYGLAPLETQKAALASGLPPSWLTGMVLLNHKAWLYGFYKP